MAQDSSGVEENLDARIVGAARQEALSGGGKARIAKRVVDVLIQDENLLDFAVQTKLKAPVSPEAVLVTNRRILVAKAGLLGRLNVEDANWVDVKSVAFDQSMMNAKLAVALTNGNGWVVEGLEKDSAKRVYSFAREAENQSNIRRRDLRLEEARAQAGGVQVTTYATPPQAPPGAGNPGSDIRARLTELKALADDGLITPAEYEAKRADLIKRA